jgi:hypothetical protein
MPQPDKEQLRKPDKKQLRKMKRDIKKLGGKRLRKKLKENLRDHPAEAHEAEVDFGRFSSKPWNRLDQDATRRRDE